MVGGLRRLPSATARSPGGSARSRQGRIRGGEIRVAPDEAIGARLCALPAPERWRRPERSWLPLCLLHVRLLVDVAGQHEQEIRKPVQEGDGAFADVLVAARCARPPVRRAGRRCGRSGSGRRAGEPPGRMKFFSGFSVASNLSISFSRGWASFGLDPVHRLPLDAPRGGKVGPQHEQLLLDLLDVSRPASGSPLSARTIPRTELSSSIVPYASMRMASFGTRCPPNSDVSPVSPVLV